MSVQEPAQRAPTASQENTAAARRSSSVWYRISAEQGYLRSELFNRQTVDETKQFLEAVLASAVEHRLPLVLIRVRNSVPIFTVERYGFSGYLDLAFKSRYKIALVGDTLELRIAHQYIATMARMHGVKLRAFPDESSAISWLKAGEASSR
jgi:uncharacterized protein YtpQ (UPF0354 family)